MSDRRIWVVCASFSREGLGGMSVVSAAAVGLLARSKEEALDRGMAEALKQFPCDMGWREHQVSALEVPRGWYELKPEAATDDEAEAV